MSKVILFLFILLCCLTVPAQAITFEWAANQDATSYELQSREVGQPDTAWRVIASNVTGRTVTLTPEKYNQNYEYRVIAANECGKKVMDLIL